MTVAAINAGQEFTVDTVKLKKEIGKRLADIGFTHGAKGQVIRKALLGDPIQIRLNGFDIMIRASEAEGIDIAADEA